VVFGPKPRSYRIDLPRKVKRLARRSALNARANDGALYVIERFDFEQPKTKQLLELLAKLELTGKKVLVLTAELQPAVYRSGRNLANVHVMQYAEVTALEVLWADALIVEEAALGSNGSAGVDASTSGEDEGGSDDA
jgi:large subunit ribosomal protein L4